MSETIPYIIAENGYYYVAYKEKVKVPYIVVSSKGIANGLSEEYNDGWDFGPDSYSPSSTSAIPYTQTTGTGEGYQYAINNGYFKIVLGTGTFHIKEQITITQPVDFEGQGGTQAANETINGVYSPYNVPSISGYPTVVINEIPTANTPMFNSDTYMSGMKMRDMILVGNGNAILWFTSPTSVPNNAHFDFTGSRFINGTTSTTNSVRFVDLSGYGDLQLINYLQDTTGLSNGGLILGGDNCSIRLINPMNYVGYIAVNIGTNVVEIAGGLTNQLLVPYGSGGGITNINIVTTTNPTITPYGSLSSDGVPQNTSTSQYSGATVELGYTLLNNSIVDLSYVSSSTYPVINVLAVKNCFIYQSETFFRNVPSGVTAVDTIFALFIENIQNDGGSTWTDIGATNMVNADGINYQIIYKPTIATPSVPASGTALQNTNAYPVKVYINGGAITEIQVSIGGTAYTVYSNSTASAVYEGFTLPIGASITLTYSTAPTWEWVPE